MTCSHVWKLDMKAVNGVFPGKCKLCGEKRDFLLFPKVSRMGKGAWGRAGRIGVVD